MLLTGLEVVNVCRPRAILAPAGAPWYQFWAALLGLGIVSLAGLGYLLVRRPDRRMRDTATGGDRTDELAPAVL
nr:hypothetical protein [Streptomyces sp. 846.5]